MQFIEYRQDTLYHTYTKTDNYLTIQVVQKLTGNKIKKEKKMIYVLYD